MGFKKIGIITPDITDGDVTHAPDANSVFDALALKINYSEKGTANGVATLDESKLVPTTQLPSYVDDVLEFATLSVFPVTGETGKIYVDIATNKTYRWSGSVYIYITSGAVDSVAGKTGVVSLVKGDVGLSNVDNTADVNKPVVTTLVNGIMSSTDKVKLDAITGTNTGDYVHPIEDGNLHVPANNITSSGKVLTSGATAGNYFWSTPNQSAQSIVLTPITANFSAASDYFVWYRLYTNTGAPGSVTVTLSAGAPGLCFRSIVTTAYDFIIKSATGQTIRYLSTVSIPSGSIKSASIGDELQLDWDGTQWVASINGSWQLETS